MALAEFITLRYRGHGHVRFDLPAAVCTPDRGQALVEGLRSIDGIYRIDLHARRRKLSIRYAEGRCSFDQVCTALRDLVNESTEVGSGSETCCGGGHVTEASSGSRPARQGPIGWLRTRLGRTAGSSLVARPDDAIDVGNPPPMIREATVIEFLNDVLVLYLIKLHWHMIMQHWLRQPWRHRYEWLAAFYMIYLLVRSRRPKT